MSLKKIASKCEDGLIVLCVNVPDSVDNTTSCDLFVGENDFLFSCDYITYRYQTGSRIDVKDMKALHVEFDTKERQFTFRIPLLPVDYSAGDKIQNTETSSCATPKSVNILEMQRFADTCTFTVDGEWGKFEKKFSYGFGGNYTDDTSLLADTLRPIARISNPSHYSPIQKWYERERDEKDDFRREQYKLNFVELQVPDGLENPAKFTFSCSDSKLDTKQEHSLKVILEKPLRIIPGQEAFIDCGLIELVLAICYDTRSTQNEPTCESAWTRSILTTMLVYFEPISSLRMVIENFLRRSLIYPLYRNYDLSRMCIEDAIEALQKGSKWILKQLLITYGLFMGNEAERSILNKYFIEDYIRYASHVEDIHMRTLSRNLKNLHLNIMKKDLRLDLCDIETELLKELIEDIHLGNSDDSDEDDEAESGEEDEGASSEGGGACSENNS